MVFLNERRIQIAFILKLEGRQIPDYSCACSCKLSNSMNVCSFVRRTVVLFSFSIKVSSLLEGEGSIACHTLEEVVLRSSVTQVYPKFIEA